MLKKTANSTTGLLFTNSPNILRFEVMLSSDDRLADAAGGALDFATAIVQESSMSFSRAKGSLFPALEGIFVVKTLCSGDCVAPAPKPRRLSLRKAFAPNLDLTPIYRPLYRNFPPNDCMQ